MNDILIGFASSNRIHNFGIINAWEQNFDNGCNFVATIRRWCSGVRALDRYDHRANDVRSAQNADLDAPAYAADIE